MRWMKMLDLKPYGAFIENTLRPMIEEAQTLLSDLHGYGLYFCKEDIEKIIKNVAARHVQVVILQCLTNVIITGIICWTAWTISQ